MKGVNAVMPTIVRKSSKPYRWVIGQAPLSEVANQEKKVPRDFITEDGFGITEPCRRYLAPLIAGEAPPPYKDGLPGYVRIKGVPVKKQARAPNSKSEREPAGALCYISPPFGGRRAADKTTTS